jgi:hypothetical protein
MEQNEMERNRYGKKKLKCPYLLNWVGSQCRVSAKPYYPSLFELREYCANKNHTRCPLVHQGTIYQFDVLG